MYVVLFLKKLPYVRWQKNSKLTVLSTVVTCTKVRNWTPVAERQLHCESEEGNP